ncbi:MAG: hypothetical protein ACPGJI_06915 [Kangiellaceae bacterium]
MKLDKISIQNLLLEFTAILVGIVLALAIDQWQQDREINQKAELAQNKILKEITSNFKEVKEFNEIVKSRYKKLKAIEKVVDGSKGFHEYIHNFVGYRFTELNDSAWQRANNGILANYMDEEFIEQALHLYNWNNTLQTFHLKMNDFLYQPYFFDPKQAKYAWHVSQRYKSQQISWSNSMLKAYSKFMENYSNNMNE